MSEKESQLTLPLEANNGDKSTSENTASFDLAQATVAAPERPTVDVQDFETAELMRAWIFSSNDLLEKLVYVDEWRMNVLLVGLTATQRNAAIMSAAKSDGTPDLDKLYADLVIKSARHPKSREPLFHPADRNALNQRSGKVLDQLATIVSELSGLAKDDKEAATKNSNSIQS